jgi:hypothetical protein
MVAGARAQGGMHPERRVMNDRPRALPRCRRTDKRRRQPKRQRQAIAEHEHGSLGDHLLQAQIEDDVQVRAGVESDPMTDFKRRPPAVCRLG